MAPWVVSALQLGPADAIDLLISIPRGAPPGVAIGESLRFLGEVAKLALEFVARGKALPTLQHSGADHLAMWRALPDGESDAGRIQALAAAMPPLCRAALDRSPARPGARKTATDWSAVTGPAAEKMLSEMIDSLVDACIRQEVGGQPPKKRRGRRPGKQPAAAAWLCALTSAQPVVAADPAELVELQQALEQWSKQALSTPQGSFRTCFRLCQPADTGGKRPKKRPGPWMLEFLLQARDDRSLLVPAEAVWNTRGGAATFLRRRLDNPQERFLGDLGHATRLFPDLEPALKTAMPARVELDAAGAHRFLREAAPLLEQAGFGVLVPPWWNRPAARLGVKLKAWPPKDPSVAGAGILGLETICAYEWEIALGEETISFDELRRIARLKLPLVQLRGQWVELRRDQIDAALAFFSRQQAAGSMTAAEMLRIGLGLDASQAGLPVVAIEARGWIGELLGEDGSKRLETVKAPRGFCGTLRPYQNRGLSWLSFLGGLGLGGCLADDMGLGKTIQLLALLLAERQGRRRKDRPGPTLLVCPMSVVGNWQREAQRFAPKIRVYVHHGAERLSGQAFSDAVRQRDLVLTTYALAARDQERLGGVDWGRVALDEAQNIKNSAARQTRAVRGLRAGQRVALTGTPVENRLSELWSIMEFLNPGLLGSASDFRSRFAVSIERYRDEGKAALLRRITGPFILRRLKTDRSIIADLPDKLEMRVFCNLTREQASLYQAVVDEMLQRIDSSAGIGRKGLVLATMMKLKQVCNHPAQLLQDRSSLDGRSGKLARLEQTLEEVLAGGERALCFTQFAEMGHLLKPHLQRRLGIEVLYLHGGTTKKARDAMVSRFQGDGGPPVFLLSLKAGGTGLNLTAASHVIHFDRWWNPAVENQATDRAFRIGQKKNVQVRKFVCVGTLEERIDEMIEQKKDLAERIVGTGESWLTELSTAQLREIVALSADAVAEG